MTQFKKINEEKMAHYVDALYAGISAGFEWDLGKAKKLGDWTEKIKLTFSLFDKEFKLKEWNVDGVVLSITESVVLGEGGVLAADFVVNNTGESPMDWRADYLADGVVSVDPATGVLDPAASVTVRVSLDTDKLDTGIYENTDAGSEVIASKVNLSWNYPDAATFKYVEGYVVWKTLDPNSADAWVRVADLADPEKTAYQVARLTPETTWHFAVDAYGTDVGTGYSNIVSITTPAVSGGPEPGGDFTNSVGMTFNLIPAGTFTMGSPDTETGSDSDERPQHEVTISQDFT